MNTNSNSLEMIMPTKEKTTIAFTISSDGKAWQCERTVTMSNGVLSQEIRVVGVGEKRDPASYGSGWHHRDSIAIAARLIAHEIIREASEKTAR